MGPPGPHSLSEREPKRQPHPSPSSVVLPLLSPKLGAPLDQNLLGAAPSLPTLPLPWASASENFWATRVYPGNSLSSDALRDSVSLPQEQPILPPASWL